MVKVKRTLFTVLFIIILSAATITSFADDAPAIMVGSVSAEAGSTVEVPISFVGNPGICSYTLSFSYDSEVMTLEKVTPSEEFGGSFAFSDRAVWITNGDVTTDGVFLTLRFKIGTYVERGDHAVGVFYNKGDICNYNEEDVDFTVITGKVTVVSPKDTESVSDTVNEEPSENDGAPDANSGYASDSKPAEISSDATHPDNPSGSSAVVEKALENHTESEIEKIISSSLEKRGVAAITDLAEEQKNSFVREVMDMLELNGEEFGTLSEDELFEGVSDLVKRVSDNNGSGSVGKGTDTISTNDENGSQKRPGLWLTAALVAVAVVSVIIIVSKKKSEKKRKKTWP